MYIHVWQPYESGVHIYPSQYFFSFRATRLSSFLLVTNIFCNSHLFFVLPFSHHVCLQTISVYLNIYSYGRIRLACFLVLFDNILVLFPFIDRLIFLMLWLYSDSIIFSNFSKSLLWCPKSAILILWIRLSIHPVTVALLILTWWRIILQYHLFWLRNTWKHRNVQDKNMTLFLLAIKASVVVVMGQFAYSKLIFKQSPYTSVVVPYDFYNNRIYSKIRL